MGVWGAAGHGCASQRRHQTSDRRTSIYINGRFHKVSTVQIYQTIVIGHGLLVNSSWQLLKIAAQLMIKMNSYSKRSLIIITKIGNSFSFLNIWIGMQGQLIYRYLFYMLHSVSSRYSNNTFRENERLSSRTC